MFEVGQKVWDVVEGEGVVYSIENRNHYPVVAKFSNGSERTYSIDGKSLKSNERPSLYPYPVEIVKKITKPSINWEHVSDKYKFLAQDSTGAAWLTQGAPEMDDYEDQWIPTLGAFHAAHTYASYTPGTCDWKDSLVARPKDA